jgi:hypothetical protein
MGVRMASGAAAAAVARRALGCCGAAGGTLGSSAGALSHLPQQQHIHHLIGTALEDYGRGVDIGGVLDGRRGFSTRCGDRGTITSCLPFHRGGGGVAPGFPYPRIVPAAAYYSGGAIVDSTGAARSVLRAEVESSSSDDADDDDDEGNSRMTEVRRCRLPLGFSS